MGRRIEKITNQSGTNQLTNQPTSKLTHYIYNGWQVIAETDEQGNIIRKYIIDPIQIDKPLMLEASGKKYYYIQDGMNNITGLTDEGGNLVEEYFYTPYRKLLSKPFKINPYYFSSRRLDPESGLYYFRHRYYDANLGRFLQAEPKPNVFLANLYTYARNNPVNLRDATGLCGNNPGPFPFPDPQSSQLEIFKYQTRLRKNFEIYKSYPASLGLPLSLPYIPGYFYNNFEDPWWVWFAIRFAIELWFEHILLKKVLEELIYEKSIMMVA
jgi:RHS repeat-associated protein